MPIRIAGAAGAFPEHAYSQRMLVHALEEYWGSGLARPDLLERFHARVGVETRHLAFPVEWYKPRRSWGEINTAWLEAAQRLGQRAIDAALGRAGLSRTDLDALFVVSITGIASPSLDARLINRMGLRSDIKRTPIFGLGCVGGATGLIRAADYVRAYPEQHAALLAVELCSLTLQRDDVSTANLISSALFADGAAAAIVAGSGRQASGPEIVTSRSVFYPDSEDIMGWDISEKGFRIVLSPKLTDLVRVRLAHNIDTFLDGLGLTRGDIRSWVMHPGGPKVLETVADSLGLSGQALEPSWECLRRFGNLSSASVLLVLEEVMGRHRPPEGTLGLMVAMGPGFCSELILLRW
jgi:alkylresorcinol/alkylpyrone synthase